MQDAELLRYSRHILLDEIGIEGQTRITQSRALIVGAGGLGSPAAMYLACAGVGHITLMDDDVVDLTNLQRQIAHRTDAVGQAKVSSAQATLNALNPLVKVHALLERAQGDLLNEQVQQADVVLDCCDNFATRQAINAACVRYHKPLVSGAALGFDGQLSVFHTHEAAAKRSPCYACLFPPDSPPAEANCATMGVFAPLVGIIGTMQAAETLKLLAGVGHPLAGRLLLLDARSMRWTEIGMAHNPACSVCGTAQTEVHTAQSTQVA
jgi:molybdopterin/thiamine biosynthesis adenylyltransferase